jgi:hypothetical protein
MSAPSALAAAARSPWIAWIRTSTVSPSYRDIVLLGHALKSAHWPFIFFSIFSEYLRILASSKFCIDLNSSQKILK